MSCLRSQKVFARITASIYVDSDIFPHGILILFVFVIDNQYLSVLFTAPQHYEIGLNSLCLEDIVSIEKRSFAEIQKLKSENQFLDISFLYPQLIGAEIDDIEIIQDETKEYPILLAVLIRLHNGLCLTISEEIDNPMLRVFSNKQEAKKTIRAE